MLYFVCSKFSSPAVFWIPKRASLKIVCLSALSIIVDCLHPQVLVISLRTELVKLLQRGVAYVEFSSLYFEILVEITKIWLRWHLISTEKLHTFLTLAILLYMLVHICN